MRRVIEDRNKSDLMIESRDQSDEKNRKRK